jgi:hypothetical protein
MNNTALNPHLRQTNVIGSAFCQSDYRLGNLVTIDNELLVETKNEIYRVSGIEAKLNSSFPDSKLTLSLDHTMSIRTYHQFEEFVKPIPITKKWLVDFKFENTYKSKFRLKFDHLTHQEIGFDFSRVEDKSMEGFRFYGHYIKIQYIHQLQNLFYCLTGQELVLS